MGHRQTRKEVEELVEQQKPGSPEESWKQLKSNMTKVAKRIVGFKKELAKKPWIKSK